MKQIEQQKLFKEVEEEANILKELDPRIILNFTNFLKIVINIFERVDTNKTGHVNFTQFIPAIADEEEITKQIKITISIQKYLTQMAIAIQISMILIKLLEESMKIFGRRSQLRFTLMDMFSLLKNKLSYFSSINMF
ncbi:unnamed protein product [Paramecium octaurelia]|uniref:EF-hand domain-containing protein n=1 Tax=Paramecium octaurelia TaxID=43137 RepID=A0A8S1X611_PAROT|nr:unnamed protein product [Paramecium octaurelia]